MADVSPPLEQNMASHQESPTTENSVVEARSITGTEKAVYQERGQVIEEAAATAPAVVTGQTTTFPANSPALTGNLQPGAGASYTKGPDGHTAANFNIEQEAYNSQGIHLGYNPKRDTVTYPSRDNLSIQTIPKGTMLARLEPGGDFFIVNDEAGRIIESRDAAKISEACQVAPVKRFGGYRQTLNIYETTEDIPGAVGKAMANDQYGTGGITEAYIKNPQELEAMGILKVVDTVKLSNWEVSEARFKETSIALDSKVGAEWSVSQNKPASIADISKTLQRSSEETEQALAVDRNKTSAIRQQLQRDKSDIKGIMDELTSLAEQNRIIEVQGPLTTRNILRQGEQIIAQVKSLSPTEQKIPGLAAHIAMGTAALGGVGDDRDKPAQRNAIDAQLVENVSTVNYSTVKVKDVWITLMHERNRTSAEIKEQARRRPELKGDPMTEQQARERAASDYVHGEDRELARQTQALQRDRAQLQQNEAWNNEFGRLNGFDRPFWKYVPGWLKSDLIKDYEHNLKTIDRQHEELAYRESELVEKTEKLQERLQSPGAQEEIERQIPLYLARDAERLEQLANTDEKTEALTGEQKQINRMKSCFSPKIADRLIRVEGDPGDAANIMKQFDRIQEQIRDMPEIAQRHSLAR